MLPVERLAQQRDPADRHGGRASTTRCSTCGGPVRSGRRGASRRDAIDIAAATSGRAVVVSGHRRVRRDVRAAALRQRDLQLDGGRHDARRRGGRARLADRAARGARRCSATRSTGRASRSCTGCVGTAPGRFWPAVMRVVLAKPLVSLLVAGTAMLALAAPALGMKLGEVGRRLAAALDPDHADLRRDDGGVPADRVRAHGRGLVGQRASRWTRPPCTPGWRRWSSVGRAQRPVRRSGRRARRLRAGRADGDGRPRR